MSEIKEWQWPAHCDVDQMAQAAEAAGLGPCRITARPVFEMLLVQARFSLTRHRLDWGWTEWTLVDLETPRRRPVTVRARLWPLYLLAEVDGRWPDARVDIAFDHGDHDDQLLALSESMGDPCMMPLDPDDG